MARLAALTGGTGFLGRYLALALAQAGYRVRLLARRNPLHPQLQPIEFEIVPGALSDPAAVDRLVDGAELVIHAAGLVKAADPAAFLAVNRDGAAAVATAMRRAGSPARLVVVSSLAARAPEISDYAASKRAGEAAAVAALGSGNWLILRPAAIYGPWDRELLVFFRAAARGFLPILGPPQGRVALIHAEDAAAAILRLGEGAPSGQLYALADENAAGYTWGDLVALVGEAVGVRGRAIRVSPVLMRGYGAAAGWHARLSGRPAMASSGKIRELLHPDWGVGEQEGPPRTLWRPRWPLAAGLAATALWYRGNGLLRG